MSSLYTVVLNVGADVHAADQDGNTALHIAAQYGHELLINTLLQHEANILKYLFFVCVTWKFDILGVNLIVIVLQDAFTGAGHFCVVV